MSTSDLVRWSGLAAVAGGVLFVVAGLLAFTFPDDLVERAATGTFVVQQPLLLLATVLLLLGLFGLYASQSEAAGVLGVVGFLLAFFGTALLSGGFWSEVFVFSFIPPQSPDLIEAKPWGNLLSSLTFTAGWLVFGIATLRAGVYPRAAAIVLIVGAVVPPSSGSSWLCSSYFFRSPPSLASEWPGWASSFSREGLHRPSNPRG